MNGINVQTEGIASALGSFKGKVAELQATFDEINSLTDAIKGSWEGTSSDSITSAVKAFQSTYDAIDSKTKTYATFLDGVISTYTEEDEGISAGAEGLSD